MLLYLKTAIAIFVVIADAALIDYPLFVPTKTEAFS